MELHIEDSEGQGHSLALRHLTKGEWGSHKIRPQTTLTVGIAPSPKYFLDREIAITGKAPGQGNTEGLGSAPVLWSLEGENRSELGVESQHLFPLKN